MFAVYAFFYLELDYFES